MTATTAVPSYRRLARLTPYLLAAGLAIIAWLLLGSHAAFAEERTGSGSHRPHLAEATGQDPHAAMLRFWEAAERNGYVLPAPTP